MPGVRADAARTVRPGADGVRPLLPGVRRRGRARAAGDSWQIRPHRQGLGGIAGHSRHETAPALPAWAGEVGWESDVVLSTRARLARNLADSPFSGARPGGGVNSARWSSRCCRSHEHREKGFRKPLRAVEIGKLGDGEKTALVDSHLISVQHASAGSAHRWALVDDKHTVSVMVNEEDHLRLQAILPGFQLDAARTRSPTAWTTCSLPAWPTPLTRRYGYLTSSLVELRDRDAPLGHGPPARPGARPGKLEDALTAASAPSAPPCAWTLWRDTATPSGMSTRYPMPSASASRSGA